MKRLARGLVAFLFLSANGWAQQVLTTFAGSDWVFSGNGKPAIDAPLSKPSSVTLDPMGNPVFADFQNCIVAALQKDGTLSVIAGNGFCAPHSGNGGSALNAAIEPFSIAYDPQGNLYIGEFNRIRKVSAAGIITAVGGTGQDGYSGDNGPATVARFSSIAGLAADGAGNLYVADSGNNRIRRIDPSGIVTTFAGNGNLTFNGDQGPATSMSVPYPAGIALYQGALYISDLSGVRKVAGGTISTLVSGSHYGTLSFDKAGALYLGSFGAAYRLAPGAAAFEMIAGCCTVQEGFGGDDGPATQAHLGAFVDLVPDNAGNLWLADTENSRIRKVTTDGIIRTVAGNGNFHYAGEGLPATVSPLRDLWGVAADNSGTVYLSEGFNNFGGSRVRKISGGMLTTFAGTGDQGNSGNGGDATKAGIYGPAGLAADAAGNVYIADFQNSSIRKVDATGIISVFAQVDGGPLALAFDPSGNLYATVYNGSLVERFDSKGNATIVAGSGTGFSGDSGPAVSAKLSHPYGIAFDASGNLYVADSGNDRIRKVNPQGVITTVASTNAPFKFSGPQGLAFDAAGNLYIGEDGGYVDCLTPAGVLSRYAGGGPDGQLGDGKVPTAATLSSVNQLAFDRTGNLYIVDTGNDRIRVVPAAAATIQADRNSLTFSAPSGGAPVRQTVTIQGSLAGLDFTVAVQTAPGMGWLTSDSGSGSTPRILTITADPSNLTAGAAGAIVITPAAAKPASIHIPVNFAIGAAQPPVLATDVPSVSFAFPMGAQPGTSTIKILNTGGGVLNFKASAATKTGGKWLSVSPLSGSVKPGVPFALTVAADPTIISQSNTYSGSIRLDAGLAGTVTLPAILALSDLSQAISLTQSGMSFLAVEKGGVVPPQSFGIVSTGSGTVAWSATASTLTGGDWLKLSPQPATGSSAPGAVAPQLSVIVEASALSAGNYFGLVTVAAKEAANSPQLLVVALQVLPAGSNPGAVIQPSEVVFTPSIDSAPGSQTIAVYNLGSTPQNFQTSSTAQAESLYASPRTGTLSASRPTLIELQPTGVYNGALTLAEGGYVQTVKATTIAPRPAVPGIKLQKNDVTTPCAPTLLMPAVTSLGSSFTVSAGWPVALTASVHDDCGNPHVSGSVTVNFSNGDSLLTMQPLGDGTWQGTWASNASAKSDVTLTVNAVNDQLGISGVRQLDGGLGSLQDIPAFDANSVVSAASPQQSVPLAPGSVFSIYGDRLAETIGAASFAPLPQELGGSYIVFGDKRAPMFCTSQNQLNAIVPFGVNFNTSLNMVVKRGNTYSKVVKVFLAPGQPGVFAYGGIAIAYVYRSGMAPFQATPQTPAQAGDVLALYCGGLGLVAQTPDDGGASPDTELKNSVTATIGGQDAAVTFAGLVEGMVGLYRVNLTVPSGIVPPGTAAGTAVPLILTVSGQTSPAAALAVQ